MSQLETAIRERLDGHDKQITTLFEMMAEIIDEGPRSTNKKRIGMA